LIKINVLVRVPQIAISVSIGAILAELALPWRLRLVVVLALLSLVVVIGDVQHLHLDFDW
jgi:hypothetical protein